MNPKPIPNHTHATEDRYRYLKPASAQDCTGLIPAGIVNEDELENYEELYPFLPYIPQSK